MILSHQMKETALHPLDIYTLPMSYYVLETSILSLIMFLLFPMIGSVPLP